MFQIYTCKRLWLVAVMGVAIASAMGRGGMATASAFHSHRQGAPSTVSPEDDRSSPVLLGSTFGSLEVLHDCQIECSAGAMPEGEPTCTDQYEDYYNSGCENADNGWGRYVEIACGTTVCGHTGTFLTGAAIPTRDEDYYEFTVTEPTEVTWTVNAEFPVSIGLIDDTYQFSCQTATTLAENTGVACESVSITRCVAAGRYVVWVMPDTYDGVSCGSVYEATLIGQPCGSVVVGACCHLDDSSCDEVPQYRCDASPGGDFQGNWVLCSEVECVQPVTADDCYDATEAAVPSTVWVRTVGSQPDIYPDCGISGIDSYGGVWAKVVGTGHEITATTCNNDSINRSTALRVYCGSCDAAVCVAGDDHTCSEPSGDGLSTVTWCSELGQEYYILVVNKSIGTCRLDIFDNGLSCSSPPDCTVSLGACCVDGVCVADEMPEYECASVAPHAAWLVGEDCTTASCPSCPGNTCDDAIEINTLPFNTEGETCLCRHDYDDVCGDGSGYQRGRDVVYAYTPTEDVIVDIRTCRASDFQTLVYVYKNVCQAADDGQPPYACGGSSCVSPELAPIPKASAIDALPLTAGDTYYIVVDSRLDNSGDPNSCGQYTLDVTEWTPINLECPEGASTESELCGESTNDGCLLDSPQFEPIAIGESVCGTCWFGDDPHDDIIDWYQVVVTEDSQLTWTVSAEFWFTIAMPAVFPPGSGDCGDYVKSSIYYFDAGVPGEEVSFTTDCLPPGTYWFTVEYGPGKNAWPCGGTHLGNNYVATVTAESCSLPKGACCRPDATCELEHSYWCSYGGNRFGGVGSNCSSTLCTPFRCDAFGECRMSSICEVSIGDIINESMCGGYENYTHLSTTMHPGDSYSLWFGYGGTLYPNEVGGAWVDWNHDLDFDDPGEQIELHIMEAEGGFTGVITPPLDAVSGTTTLRLRTSMYNVGEPCGGCVYGEVEDYTINLVDIEGACCALDHQCHTMNSADGCLAVNGVWFPGETCEDGFECPVGACCTDRECETLDEGPCLEQGGTWYAGETCVADGGDFSCLYADLSACCTYEGDCIMVETEFECQHSGTYSGVFHPGEWCTDAGGDFDACSELGACCKPYDCNMTTEAECAYGVWHAGEVCIEDGGTIDYHDDYGACCRTSGECWVVTGEAVCDQLEGTWYPDEMCTAVPGGDFFCPNAEGACCTSAGDCVMTQEQAECSDSYSGTFHAGETCVDAGGDFVCPTQSACCTPAGDCIMTDDQAECVNLYNGVFHVGATCVDAGGEFECPDLSACCTSGGECVMTEDAAECVTLHSGTFHVGEICVDAGGDFECPESGACCTPDGMCQGWADQQQCLSFLQGTWYPGEDCYAGFECPAVASACCTSDGQCVMADGVADCVESYGGTFYAGEACVDSGGDFECPVWGACCTPSGSCRPADSEGSCTAIYGGTFYEEEDCGTFTCPTSSGGACCASDGTCYSATSDSECIAFYSGTYYEGEDCSTFTCPTSSGGACCASDGNCYQAANNGECMAFYNGTYYEGENCGTFTCPTSSGGACCTSDGYCFQTNSEGECMAFYSGTYYEGEDCGTFTCPTSSGGACCASDGNCYQTASNGECMAFYNGTYYEGEDCSTFTCPTSSGGACCTSDGYCFQTNSEGECMAFYSGTYYEGEDCGTFTCPTSDIGACCASDGTCQGWADEDQCSSILHGTWYAGEDCSAGFVCPAVSSACCTLAGECVMTDSPSECAATYNGAFYPGETCVDDGGDFVCPESGACCSSDGNCYQTDSEGLCMAMYGGTWYEGEMCVDAGGDFVCPQEAGWCDLDTDTDVDFDDYAIFLDAFGGPVDGNPPQDDACDYDNSGAVGMSDFAAWLDCYRDFIGDPQAAPPSRSEPLRPRRFTPDNDPQRITPSQASESQSLQPTNRPFRK